MHYFPQLVRSKIKGQTIYLKLDASDIPGPILPNRTWMMHFGSALRSFQIYADGGAIIKGQGSRV